MRTNRLFRVLPAFALVVVAGSDAHAQQLAKQGKYRGTFGARAAGTAHELDKDHVFFVGGFNGIFLNAVANGFLDRTVVDCPGVADIVNGLEVGSHGYCIVTDKDGDKAFLRWKGHDTSPGVGGGDFQWTGGTGKYSGIKGNNTFRFNSIGDTSASVVVWEGEWQLP